MPKVPKIQRLILWASSDENAIEFRWYHNVDVKTFTFQYGIKYIVL